MDADTFLSWVVPKGNNYSVFKMPSDDGKRFFWPTKNFTDQSKLVNYLSYIASTYSRDTYFALASFIVGSTPNAQGKEVCHREQTNVAALRSFWIDIDCKGDANTYPDKSTAIRELVALIAAGEVPRPSILVDSGNGVHVYWCLDEDVHPDDWKPVALGFRDRLVKLGLKIDEGITIDSSRILRLPGTTNFKDPNNPKPVRVLDTFAAVPWDVMAPFAAFAGTMPAGSAATGSVALSGALVEGTDADFEIGDISTSAREVFHMEHIVADCPQMAAMLANGGADVPEPLWKSMLLVAARCEDGREWAHKLSSGHPDYVAADTDAKFDRQVQVLNEKRAGPTRCATFGVAKPGLCALCPHKANIASPILLGREALSVPPGYQVRPDGIYHKIYDEEAGDWVWEKACSTVLDRVQLYHDKDEGPTLIGNYKAGLMSGQFALSHAMLSVPPSRSIEKINRKGLMIAPHEIKGFQTLMMDWSSVLKTRKLSVPPAKTIGWSDTKTHFVYRGRSFTEEGETSTLFIDDNGFEPYHSKGNRAAWFDAEAHMLAAPLELQTIVLMSFAAPLVAFTSMDGFVFSFRSTGSGRGKSTALRMGASLWGDPTRTHFNLADTPKSVLRRIGLTPHLPAYWDEVRIIGDPRAFEGLAKTVFEIAQGREMTRLRADTSFNTSGHWKTLLGVCTNHSLIDLASAANTGPEPVLARLLEIDLPELELDATGDAAHALNALQANYGYIGLEFVAYVVSRRKAIAKAIEEVASALAKKAGAGVKRYWTIASAVMIVAAQLANKSGLFRIDPAAVADLLVRTMDTQSMIHAEATQDYSSSLGIFREWFLSSHENWLVTETAPYGPGRAPEAKTLVDPTRGMIFHIDMNTGTARVKATAVNEWCKRKQIAPLIFRRGLSPDVVLTKATIGAGTAFSDRQSPCLEFNIDALDVREAVDGQVERVRNFGGRL